MTWHFTAKTASSRVASSRHPLTVLTFRTPAHIPAFANARRGLLISSGTVKTHLAHLYVNLTSQTAPSSPQYSHDAPADPQPARAGPFERSGEAAHVP